MNRVIRPLLFLSAILTLSLLATFAKPQSAEPSGTSTSFGSDASPLALRIPKPLSKSEEAALKPKGRFSECQKCPMIVVVPRGNFMMGANAGEAGSFPDELPQHEVTIRRFGAGEFPVTINEWMACVLARGCSYRPKEVANGNGRQAIGNILFDDAKEYVQWLSRSTDRPYSLLSEAEREYVTRAGTTTAFWWGDSESPPDTSYLKPAELSPMRATILASAELKPNPWGLYAVHGSIYDWVEDCWHENYRGAPTDGSAWTAENCDKHVLRGGAAGRSPQTRRSAARLWFGSPNRLVYMGVRVARRLPE
jgi:formylglycine-generating enzyme required for sulfatase activity